MLIAAAYWTWWQGALALAGLATAYWLIEHRLLGVSGSLDQVADRIGGRKRDTERGCGGAPYAEARPTRHHAFFLLAIGGGALGASLLHGGFAPADGLGATFTTLFGDGLLAPIALLTGGVLVGAGTRLAGGCTSGHGLCGTARFNPPSLAGTAVFFGTGVAVSLLLSALFLGGGAA